MSAERYKLVIPCNETTLLPLARHRTIISQLTKLAIPDDRAVGVLFDKYETRELARAVHVPVAAGRLAHRKDNAEALFAEFGTPLVLKPRHSYSLERLAARGRVHVITEALCLERFLTDCDFSETLIEQFFEGRGIGVSVLASQGRLLQAFEHHRVREIAGASFYRRSAPLTPDLVRACEAITAALEYTGIAMFEFKLNPTGGWILLEVNARPWGSMPLPLALGVDFPFRWYRLLTAEEETLAVPYRIGVYGRNLLPDLQMSRLEAASLQLGSIARARFMMGRVAELSRVLVGQEVNDVLVRDDPLPALYETLEIAQALKRRLRDLKPGEIARRQRRARAKVQSLSRMHGNVRINFVCQGNICRSPFAAALLRTRTGDGRITVESAGIMAWPGRQTPMHGIAIAALHGVDLSAHRSAWLTRASAETASLMFVFDEIILQAVLDRYPDLKTPIILLGDLAALGEIVDPVDGGVAAFKHVYEQIAAAIAELHLLLDKATR